MEVPIELLPDVARKRVESLMRTMRRRCSTKETVDQMLALARFSFGMEGRVPYVSHKQVGDGAIEGWVYDRLKRDEDWVEETARSLYDEAVDTRGEAVKAQLCSAIGKDVPEDFDLSEDEKADAWDRALFSAQSVADTYNESLRKWIEEAKAEWYKGHGDSYVGLNRFNLLKLVQMKVEKYDDWKVPEIATTEFSTQWQEQTMSFWAVNKGDAELEYYLAPEGASDPARDTEPKCFRYSGKWLSEDDAALFPAHTNCIHYISRTRVKDGSLPLYFAIGAVRYRTEELPECE